MNTFLCLAFVISLAGSVAAPVGAVLFKSYQDERRRIEAGEEPMYLPETTEQLYEPPKYRHPEVVEESEEDNRPKKILGLPVAVALNNSVERGGGQTNSRELLWQLLERHEDGWLLDLLQCPVLIWGAQGSYKSYFAAFLALTRKVLFGHGLELNDPHLELNKQEAWKALLATGIPAYGAYGDYGAIARRIQAFYQRIKDATCDKPWYTPIFDEVSDYTLEEAVKALSQMLLRKCISSTRKQHEAPLLIAHNNTQEMTGGSTGTHKSQKEGIIELHLFSRRKKGKFIPTFKGELSGLPDENGQFRILTITLDPRWMSADFLLEVFPELIAHSLTEQQRRDRQILEADNDSINWLIDQMRGHKASRTPPLTPETELETDAALSPEDETVSNEEGQPGQAVSRRLVDFWMPGTVSKFFSDTSETELFKAVKAAAIEGQKAREIIRGVLKCTKSELDSDRHYSHVGKPLFAYLIRRYGDSKLIEQFADFWEDNK
jgi:hypothetical protein